MLSGTSAADEGVLTLQQARSSPLESVIVAPLGWRESVDLACLGGLLGSGLAPTRPRLAGNSFQWKRLAVEGPFKGFPNAVFGLLRSVLVVILHLRQPVKRSPISTFFEVMRQNAKAISELRKKDRPSWDGIEIEDHLSPEDWKAIDAELVQQAELKHDRGVAIVFCALVEDRTKWLLERQFRIDLSESKKSFFFKGAGPLSSLYAQVRLLDAMGVMPNKLGDTINKIAEIRNKFAHSAKPVKFSDPKIIGLCSELKSIHPASAVSHTDPMEIYGATCLVVMTTLLVLGQCPQPGQKASPEKPA